MLIKFNVGVIPDDLFKRVQGSFVNRALYWLVDWRYRKSVKLSSWLEEQVVDAEKEIIDVAKSIKIGTTHDETVVNVLKWVNKNIKYIADDVKWETPDKWATAYETLTLETTTSKGTFYSAMSGDCEDGAVLSYVLCRLKGVPASRLIVFCGDVLGGGHCWLGYRPDNYPLNYTFLDWCYWYSSKNVGFRNFFYLNKNIVYEYKPDGSDVSSKYYGVWFGFNEEVSIKNFVYKSLLL